MSLLVQLLPCEVDFPVILVWGLNPELGCCLSRARDQENVAVEAEKANRSCGEAKKNTKPRVSLGLNHGLKRLRCVA